MDDYEKDLEAERRNGDRLAAALRTALHQLRPAEREELEATIISKPENGLCVGHVIDGALVLHDRLVRGRHGTL